MKIKISSILRIVISFGLLGLLFWIMRDDVSQIGSIIASCNLKLIGFAAIIIVLNVSMLAYRMKEVFLGENLNITFTESLQLTFIGYFFNNFMPTAVGGDIVKAHYAAKHNGKKVQSYASVLMDRFLGLYTFLLVAAVALVVDRGRFQIPAVRTLVFILLVVGLGGFVVATNTAVARFMERFLAKIKMMRLGERIHSIYEIVHDYRNRKDVVLKSLLISIVAQCMYFFAVYLFFLSLGTKISLGNIFLIMPVVTFISMIPSVGGLGVREGAIVAFFTPLAGKEISFAVSMLFLFGLLFISFIGGIIYLYWSIFRSEGKVEVASDQ